MQGLHTYVTHCRVSSSILRNPTVPKCISKLWRYVHIDYTSCIVHCPSMLLPLCSFFTPFSHFLCPPLPTLFNYMVVQIERSSLASQVESLQSELSSSQDKQIQLQALVDQAYQETSRLHRSAQPCLFTDIQLRTSCMYTLRLLMLLDNWKRQKLNTQHR